MTYEQYWEQDPWLASDYRKAWDLHKQDENARLWLQGLYNHMAVSVALANAFKKKGSKAERYFEKPIDFKKEAKSVKEIRDETYEKLKRFEEMWNGRQH